MSPAVFFHENASYDLRCRFVTKKTKSVSFRYLTYEPVNDCCASVLKSAFIFTHVKIKADLYSNYAYIDAIT